jgi:predicted ATPase
MVPCTCKHGQTIKRIVLTGGPGAGKTAVLELVRLYFCHHLRVLPESASILFSGGFPRGRSPAEQRAVQQAIFSVQRELEGFFVAEGEAAILLCDRGTVDGAAYWPGPDTLWQAVGTTREAEMQRYAAVFHLRTPPAEAGYDQSNPVRTETALEARAVDERILAAWDGHPHRLVIASTTGFFQKAHETLARLRAELPGCCQKHHIPGEVAEPHTDSRNPCETE